MYHAGYEIISQPDIHHGRKNADFGQGFYLTPDEEFARRWARPYKDRDICINRYELIIDDLNIHEFERDHEWFDYIFSNRRNKEDKFKEYDVIVGPIANDTIYDTFGVITSGILEDDTALKLLELGPEYTQIVIKTDKASKQLRWLDALRLDDEQTENYRKLTSTEEKEYQKSFAELLQDI